MANRMEGEALSRRDRKRRFQATPTTSSDGQVTPVKLKKSAFLPLADGTTVALARRCIVEYDGMIFHGFQAQAQRGTMRTVQETIEDAIARTTGETVRVKGCSRTDKGVHARGQVVVFPSRCSADDRCFRDALNTRLPDDVVCKALTTLEATDDAAFDPRADAIGKIYEYVVVSGPVRPVRDRHNVWFMKTPLDTLMMKAAIAHLTAPPQAKDFSAFTPPKSSQQNSDTAKGNICTLWNVDLIEEPLRKDEDADDGGVRVCLRFHGDRFLYKMVRNLVGTLVDVGLGRIQPDAIPSMFETKDRAKAGQGAPPQGLTLVRVLYRKDNTGEET